MMASIRKIDADASKPNRSTNQVTARVPFLLPIDETDIDAAERVAMPDSITGGGPRLLGQLLAYPN